MRSILFFCILCASASAQSPQHFFGFTVAPAATNNIQKSHNTNVPTSLVQGSMFIGGSTGFSTLWGITPRLKLQADIVYSIYSERHKREIDNIGYDPMYGFVLPGEPVNVAFIYEYHTLSIPILLNVYLNDQRSKWAWFASGGARGHIFLARYSTFRAGDSEFNNSRSRVTFGADNPNNAFSLSGQIGFGVDYKKSQNIRFRIAPYFEHFLFNTLQSSTSREEFPYAFGLTLGAYWKL